METILALAVCAIILIVINAVFGTALRLRNATSDALDKSVPLNQALAILRRDLRGAVPPGGILAGNFKCNAQSMGASLGLTIGTDSGLDFCTTTGIISDDAPWGDVQEVYYLLVDPADRAHALGRDLVRYVNRNLLATATPTPDAQWLMGDVESVQFECYDGVQWRNTWDTSMGDTNLPMAVRITIQQAAEPGMDIRNLRPLQMIVPLVTQSRTNELASAGGTGG